ncbi:MAG: glycerophosphodiester phosphodiesterase [Flavobacteriaceae bacterium]
MLRLGHRGAKAYVAENTIASIKRALSYNIDGVEIDVHCCATGELVVFHDATVDRMTNGSGTIKNMALGELKQLKVDGRFQIPILTEVLDVVGNKKIINIELKGENTAMPTCNIIKDYIANKGWAYANFLVSSFQYGELEVVYKTNPKIPIGVLTKANINDALAFAKTVSAVAIHPNYALLTDVNVKQVQLQGYKVYTWTVNGPKTILRMKQYGVNGIISDTPDRL